MKNLIKALKNLTDAKVCFQKAKESIKTANEAIELMKFRMLCQMQEDAGEVYLVRIDGKPEEITYYN